LRKPGRVRSVAEIEFRPAQSRGAMNQQFATPSINRMKTAYELAMERLGKTAPASKLTGAQKKQLAELDAQYGAKMAGREIALQDEIAKLSAVGDSEKVEALRQQWTRERKSIQAELEGKKEQIRHPAKH
jgi:hypothetical protein